MYLQCYSEYKEFQWVNFHSSLMHQITKLLGHTADLIRLLNMWIEFVVSSPPCTPRVFLWVLWFSSPHKNQLSKFQFDPEMRATGLSALLLVSPSLNKVNLLIYLFIYFIYVSNLYIEWF